MSNRGINFNSRNFLKRVSTQKTTRVYEERQTMYSQGDPADEMFYIQNGLVKLVLASPRGKQAVIAILGPGDLFGLTCLVDRSLRSSTATAIRRSTITCVKKGTVARLIHKDPAFAELIISHLLSRVVRVEEDFADRLFNSSEKRLARILLLLSQLGLECRDGATCPKVNQEHLAQMVGTTRSRISHFMNKFRKLGFVDYHGDDAITIRSGLLRVVLHDTPHGQAPLVPICLR
jgi:CRP/FNR family transcriptional regulator, cyclic AMP receptor protein